MVERRVYSGGHKSGQIVFNYPYNTMKIVDNLWNIIGHFFGQNVSQYVIQQPA
jgi:hypothetical protein